jgi:hypothetical protein
MHKFGSTGILTGYIKQLLASFELPMVRLYTTDHMEYRENKISQHILTHNERYDVVESQLSVSEEDSGINYIVPYLRDNKLQVYVDGIWKEAGLFTKSPSATYYSRGQHLLNKTKKLQIRDNVYDYYTHEYLGDYLRFLRDYDNMNLMPLYNCFSNHLCEVLEYTFSNSVDRFVTFDIADEKYKIYMIPVKLFKQYTIAMDTDSAIEICCGVYNSNLVTAGDFGKLPSKTYLKKNSCQFSYPFLYDNLLTSVFPLLVDETADKTSEAYKEQKRQLAYLAQHERDLKMFLKVPSSSTSSIVILEGDYRSWNDFVLKTDSDQVATPVMLAEEPPQQSKVLTMEPPARLIKHYNHAIVSNELLAAGAEPLLVTPLQLLRLNTQTQVPFADRLIEYLLGNVIADTPDGVSENIELAQIVAQLHYYNGTKKPGEAVTGLLDGSLQTVQAPASDAMLYRYSPQFKGLWDSSLKNIFYQYMTSKTSFDTAHDILGYVDKDVEKYFVAQIRDPKTGIPRQQTIMNTELWEA